ncbi:MAG: polysaccharide deacetylase family protein, partial [Polyangiaceae bacterium]|nr:polysaccharide deacetylase family protein [Polyangiaceae bacterium]
MALDSSLSLSRFATALLLILVLSVACRGVEDQLQNGGETDEAEADAGEGGDERADTSSEQEFPSDSETVDRRGDGDVLEESEVPPEQPRQPPLWELTGVALWRNDATAAYTIFHDDTCNDSVDHQFTQADPALAERGLVASFGAIAEDCEERGLWNSLEELRQHGHEIANHSYSHLNLTLSSTDLNQEIEQAHREFEENLADFSPSFFIFPFDAFNDSLVERLRGLGYLGARAGTRGTNTSNFSDGLRIKFDVYGPGYSIYVGAPATPCVSVNSGDDWDETTEACRSYILNQYVDDVISVGGYGLREFHSLDGEGWEPLPLNEYEEHLDYVAQK